ncbi:hypothetical protein HN51_007729 [Arachis hypogaea]
MRRRQRRCHHAVCNHNCGELRRDAEDDRVTNRSYRNIVGGKDRARMDGLALSVDIRVGFCCRFVEKRVVGVQKRKGRWRRFISISISTGFLSFPCCESNSVGFNFDCSFLML